MTAIVVDVVAVEAASSRLASLQGDLAFARSRIDATRSQLRVHPDDRGIATVPPSLDSISHRLGTVVTRLGDDAQRTRGFLHRALDIDGRSGRAHQRSPVGAWWRRLRTATTTGTTVKLTTTIQLTSSRHRLVRSARIGWSTIHRLGSAGVGLLRRSGAFVHRKVHQWKHTVTSTIRRVVIDAWQRITSWANRAWKTVSRFFSAAWNAAYSALRQLIRRIVEIAPETAWLIASLIAKGLTRPAKTSLELFRLMISPLRRQQPFSSQQKAGRDAVVSFIDSLSDETRLPQNHIMVSRTGDRYVVTIPGVEDLSLGVDLLKDKKIRGSFEAWMTSQPTGSPRDISVAWRAFLLDSNHYSTVVEAVLRRAGVPPGSEIMLIGHSHGAYTAVDLASDRRFNNASDASGSYRVTHVLSMGAAAAIEANKIGPPTQTLILNNVFDVPNTAEEVGTAHRRKLPESGADEVWFVGGTTGAGHDPKNYAAYLGDDPRDAETRRFVNSVGASYGAARSSADDAEVLIPQARDAPAYDPNTNIA